MATNNDLKWVITSKPEWADVTPMEGQGDMQVNVTIHEDVGNPAETAGTITVTCMSCKEQKQRQISVCRCTCNCQSAVLSVNYESILTDGIPQSGLTAGTKVLTYGLKSGCSDFKAKLSYSTVKQELRLENGNGYLRNAIGPNTSTSPRTITVEALYSGVTCDDYTSAFTQNGIVCNCNIFIADSFIVTIPMNGYPQGAEIGSYRLTDDGKHCPQSDIKATLSGSDATYELVCENEKVSLPRNKGISANTDPDDKHFNLVVKYNNDTCDSADIVQEGTGCGCNSFHDFTVGNIPNSGITSTTYQIGSFILDNGCSYSDYSLVEDSGSFTLSVSSDNKVYITSTVPENTTTTQNNYRVELKFRGNGCGLYKDIIQSGIDCGCGNLTSVSFITIPTEGVAAQTVIGSYGVQGDCEFTVTSSTLSLSTDSNHNIITNNAIAATTDPTGETFSVDVMFNGSSCSACTVTQRGAECTCQSSELSVDYLSVLEDGVPQTGLTAGTRILTYSINNSCSKDKIKITLSYPGGVTQEIDLRNGSGYLSSAIDETGGQRDIAVIVYYDEEECSRETFTQIGLSCSCESFIAPETEWAVLPYGGTIHQQNKWVVVATGDTGIYTSQGVLTGICGTLSGNSDDNYLVADEQTGEKIKTVVTDGHIYEFYACVNDVHVVDPSASGRKRIIIEFSFFDESGRNPECTGQTGFWIDENVCDCNKTPDLSYTDIPCEGSGDATIELGRINASEIGHSMTITAKLIGLNPIIEEFSYETSSSGDFIIKGKIPYNDGERRQIGVIMVEYMCQKGSPYQWVCDYKTSVLYQAQCESCSCDDESELDLDIPNQIDFPKTEKSGYAFIGSIPDKKCIDLYIYGEDAETGIYDGEWFKAYIEKGNRYYTLHYELVDGEHANRQATINIKSRYKETPTSPWQDCNDHFVIMHDSACYCSAVTRSMECFMADHPNGLTVNVPSGSTYGYSEDIAFYDGYDENCGTESAEVMLDCVRLCILDENNNLTGCTSSEAYEDPYGYFEAFGTSGMHNYQRRIEVEVKKDFDADKDITMVPVMLTSEGEWERCSEDTYNVHIHQELCGCDKFIEDYVSIKETTLIHREGQGQTIEIKPGYVWGGCGKGKLYVKGNDGEYYHIDEKDDPNFPDYITDMTAECLNDWHWFAIRLTSLTEEGQTRSTDFAIYRCTSDGVEEDCYKEFTIDERFETDCARYKCEDFTLGLTKDCGSTAENPCIISYTGNVDNPMKIGEFNTPTNSCFKVEVDAHNTMVDKVYTEDLGGGRSGIYIECKPNTSTQPSPISVDIDVKHIYQQDDGNGGTTTVTESCETNEHIAVRVEGKPTEENP